MRNESIRRSLRFLQWVTVTFLLTLGVLLATDIYRSKAPLAEGLEEIARLKEQDLADAKLAQTVRDLDYLYRSAYFQSVDKQKRGVLLLGIGFFTLCGLLTLELVLFQPKLKVPKTAEQLPENERRQLLVFAFCGLVMLVGGIVAMRMLMMPSSVLYEAVTLPSFMIFTPPVTATSNEPSLHSLTARTPPDNIPSFSVNAASLPLS